MVLRAALPRRRPKGLCENGRQTGLTLEGVPQIVNLTLLAPDVQEAILEPKPRATIRSASGAFGQASRSRSGASSGKLGGASEGAE